MPKKKEVVEDVSPDYTKEELLQMIQNAISEYGSEPNIPINHDYWTLLNLYRAKD